MATALQREERGESRYKKYRGSHAYHLSNGDCAYGFVQPAG